MKWWRNEGALGLNIFHLQHLHRLSTLSFYKPYNAKNLKFSITRHSFDPGPFENLNRPFLWGYVRDTNIPIGSLLIRLILVIWQLRDVIVCQLNVQNKDLVRLADLMCFNPIFKVKWEFSACCQIVVIAVIMINVNTTESLRTYSNTISGSIF